MRARSYGISAWVLLAVCGANATVHDVPDDFGTIQAAITASTHGDTVLVAPGTYEENIVFYGREIVVASWYLTTGDTTYVETTSVFGSANGPVVRFVDGEGRATRLVGVTLHGGHAQSGGGIMIQDSAPVIVGNRITGNAGGSYFGGGIGSRNSTPVITDNLIADNGECQFGGGMFY